MTMGRVNITVHDGGDGMVPAMLDGKAAMPGQGTIPGMPLPPPTPPKRWSVYLDDGFSARILQYVISYQFAEGLGFFQLEDGTTEIVAIANCVSASLRPESDDDK